MSDSGRPVVHLVDASIYVFRAWFSMPDQFNDPAGRPTNAVYGFARFLCDLLNQTGTKHLALGFDESLTTSFRNEIYAPYKANREPAPPELERQFRWCRDLAHCLGLATHADDRYEADDLIATLAAIARENGHPVCIVSSDKDLAQLVGPGDWWWDFARRRKLDASQLAGHFGVEPALIPDFLALTGDSVDNIPGIPGIGPKTAAVLLAHFGSLEAIFDRVEEIPFLSFRGARTLPGRLRGMRDQAMMARRLTRLERQVPAALANPDTARGKGDPDALDALLDSLGFGLPLRRRLHRSAWPEGSEKAAE